METGEWETAVADYLAQRQRSRYGVQLGRAWIARVET